MGSAAISGVPTVAVPAADPLRVLDFYAGTLGLEVRVDGPRGRGVAQAGEE
ncbi:MAG: hypothetical protein ACLGIF_08045 [Actinomycetes bacterium]